jgi:predicted RND superfamily exporter protein
MSSRAAIFLLSALIALSLLSGWAISRLQVDYTLDQYFPEADPDLEFYRQVKSDFPSGNETILLLVESDSGIFESSFLKGVDSLEGLCRKFPEIISSYSLLSMSVPVFSFPASRERRLMNPDKDGPGSAAVRRIMSDPRWVGSLVSADSQSLAITLEVQNGLDWKAKHSLVETLRKLPEGFGFKDWRLVGEPVFQSGIVLLQRREMFRITILAVVLILIFSGFIFRRPLPVLIILVSVVLGMVFALGYLGWKGQPLSTMASLFPALIVIVGTSDAIHLLSRYIEELASGKERREAVRTTVKEIGLATFLTSATTALGFLSLLTTKIHAVRVFGVDAAVGVMISFLVILLFTLSLFSLLDPKLFQPQGESGLRWRKWLNGIYSKGKRFPGRTFLVIGIVMGISLAGLSRLQVDFFFHKILPDRSRTQSDFIYFEQHFGGYRYLELVVTAADGLKADDFEVAREIRKVEQHLSGIPGLSTPNSFTVLVRSMNRALHGDSPRAYRMPEKEDDYAEIQAMAALKFPDLYGSNFSRDTCQTRISARILDAGASKAKDVQLSLSDWIASHTDPEVGCFQQSGIAMIMDRNAAHVGRNLMEGLFVAILVVSLIMGFLFRDPWMVLISLVPNVLPLLVAAGIMGWAGLELNASTAVVFTVIFGIAVDDTIHFLSRYRLLRTSGVDFEMAIFKTVTETGKAICMTSFILFAGFISLGLSGLPSTRIFGLLVGATLLSALFADLFLLPAMLRVRKFPILS